MGGGEWNIKSYVVLHEVLGSIWGLIMSHYLINILYHYNGLLGLRHFLIHDLFISRKIVPGEHCSCVTCGSWGLKSVDD